MFATRAQVREHRAIPRTAWGKLVVFTLLASTPPLPLCLGLNQENAALAGLRPQQPLPVKFPEGLAALPSRPGEHFPPNKHSPLHK